METNIQSNDDIDTFLKQLTPTQEHFLKKYLLEEQLSKELHKFNQPNCCQLLGYPFRSFTTTTTTTKDNDELSHELPLLSFFFKQFLSTFPFITNNSNENQQDFWQNTLQPFIESFNTKPISQSEERQENITKRRQVNKKILSGLLLFYNSMIITDQELDYLKENHYKPSDTGKLDKFHNRKETIINDQNGQNGKNGKNGQNGIGLINIVAVRVIYENPTNISSWIPFYNRVKIYHLYIIEIQNDNKNDKNDKYYIAKSYQNFKTLHHQLKKKFPGLITEIHLPSHKHKHDNGWDVNDKESIYEDETTFSNDKILIREKMRLSLRGYLKSLMKIPEIVHCTILSEFLTTNKTILTNEDIIDYNQRKDHEEIMKQTQIEFQQQTTKIMLSLTKDFEIFKNKLIMNPNTITQIFYELGSTPNIKQMSPLLQTFNEWCKVEIAATIYQTFISQDNSNEWFNKVKKFHRIFPYNIIYGILKYTNPMKIISRIVDLLLVNIPSFPQWNLSGPVSELSEHSKKNGARNLLSMIFIMLLNEDLNGFDKELTILESNLIGYEVYLQRIKNYIQLDYQQINLIREEEQQQQEQEQNEDLLLTILSTSKLTPQIDNKFNEIKSSYFHYKNITTTNNIGKLEQSELYLNLKQYWQIQIRKRDKDLFKQLWQEPELSELIKKFLIIFYQPLIIIFSKSDIHLAFKNLQKFIDDLINTIDKIINQEIYYLNSFEIYNKLINLLNRHENFIWEFIHKIYIKDDEKLFLNLIKWIEKYLIMMRIKFINPEIVKININTSNSGPGPGPGDISLNKQLFMNQLNSRVEKIITKRKLFKEYLELKAKAKAKSKGNLQTNSNNDIDDNWEDINNKIFGNTTSDEFGIKIDDLEEFNYLNVEDDLLNDLSNQTDLEWNLLNKLQKLDEITLKTNELDKLNIIDELYQVLNRINTLETSNGITTNMNR
ncbi:uncharacterized protein YPR097W orthologue, putative [Candida dubliniensis CD36]|uniref:Uncharacterized protein YPR097W orthologue, putative n=1 Tax=Candida dubliniensis (strain CD36 / ATCC MYA-646 / CBS 7987 / NCPF 3949 / NRRL Y-17841) TaxID=573826 RepID=B9WJ27_CANDC|nr:uncharacterized protein YPR097W orthologue, putative [Candida dubliniensis CD36]CAX41246.1 uncharacterized protein YPR097W orthologue, putative [Candida dubliniensis CD36]